jgi:hypothetical protein
MAGIYLCRGLKRPLLPACLPACCQALPCIVPPPQAFIAPLMPLPAPPMLPVLPCSCPHVHAPLPGPPSASRGLTMCTLCDHPAPPATAAAVPSLFLLGLLDSLTQQLARPPFHLLCLLGALPTLTHPPLGPPSRGSVVPLCFVVSANIDPC